VTERMTCAHAPCGVMFEFTPRIGGGGRKKKFCTSRCKEAASYAANPERKRKRARMRYMTFPESVRDSYLERNRQYNRERRAASPDVRERDRAQSRERYAANPEKANETTRAWQAANTEKVRGYDRVWKAANPDKRAACSNRRRASKRNAKPPLTPEEKAREVAIYAEAQRLGWHVDHIRALARGGLHHPDNLVAIPPIMNLSKGAQYWPDLHALQ
jgi:hypothetical protein